MMRSLIEFVSSPLRRSSVSKQRSRSLTTDCTNISPISLIPVSVTNEQTSRTESDNTEAENVANSTTIGENNNAGHSRNFSTISQSSISPVKKEDDLIDTILSSGTSFDQSSADSSRSDVRLDSTENRKSILIYVLQKLKTNEEDIIKLADENKNLLEKYDTLQMKYEEVCTQMDEKNSVLHNLNERAAKLKDVEIKNNEYLEELKEENNQISFKMKRLQSEVMTISDKSSHVLCDLSPDDKLRLKTLEEQAKETELKSSKNQIELEIFKDFCGEHQEKIDIINDELVRLETDITTTNQYNRRQNLIIDGIPNNIKDYQLENVCIDLIRKIGFCPRANPLTPYDVVGCHRLRKKPGEVCAPTIIRFTNRKVAEFCMKYRSRVTKINGWNLSFREDLCPANEMIYDECENLLKSNLIAKMYTHNGFVKVVPNGRSFTGGRNFPVKIKHFSDLQEMFPNQY